MNGYGIIIKKKNKILKFMSSGINELVFGIKFKFYIGFFEDFRRVFVIIDVDIVFEYYRRVKLMKNGFDKLFGFYIRDGISVRVISYGLEKVFGIFILRFVFGGLVESIGFLAVNDEVLEVNGIEVVGKILD